MEISILIILVLLILILFNRYQSKSVGINLDEDSFSIPGIFGLRVNYRDIYMIDMVSKISEIGMRTNGYYFRGVCKGYFVLEDIGNAYLNLNLKYPPYIRIVLENKACIFINLNNEKGTTELFDKLVHMTLKK
jgi:hypothetical protein